ncbi:adenine deaminase [Haliangium sp.]|uniref:adenine deaminase n=1 Tax=Haliangium sp. TaxID=2663208 RepID=UPI003D0AC3FC
MAEPESTRGTPGRALERVSGQVVDPVAGTIRPAEIEIAAGRIRALTPTEHPGPRYLVPGLVDAHVHVESSMLPPSEFARAALVRGTVAAVADPHEIANVLGEAGVRYMMADGARVPLVFGFGAPPCVPATAFETAGARLGPATVAALLAEPGVTHLSEVMNVPGVLAGDPDLAAMLAAARRLGKPIDGHAPGLMGPGLRRYAEAGVGTDHECATLAEARARVALGMKVLIREGSAARNFDALVPLLDEHPEACMLCADDTHPDDLVRGHIDDLVRRALARGIDVMKVLRAACVNPVRHYRLDVGLLQVGDRADFLELDSLDEFEIARTVVAGEVVAERGRSLLPRLPVTCPNAFEATPKTAADFALAAPPGPTPVTMPVIVAHDGQLVTERLELAARVEAGRVVADPARDLLLLTVVNRYRDAPPALALVRGFGLTRGALASSVAHDSHNIVAVGADAGALCRAVNLVIAHRGGIAAVDPANETERAAERILALPIAGLMSDRPYAEVARAYEDLNELAAALGSRQRAPFMTLSFMALLVIPALKLSDRGLFDGEAFSLLAPATGA